MINNSLIKNYSSTYLYGKGEYERNLFSYLIKSKEIDKESDYFMDIIYDVKRNQQTASLVNVLMRNDVVLLYNHNGNPTPRSFKVFTSADVRSGDTKKSLKTFIDVTDIFIFDNGIYTCKKIDYLVSYLVSAMNQIIYFNKPERILNNSSIIVYSTEAFVEMINYVLGFLKVNSFYGMNKDKILYVSALYFQMNLLSKDATDSVKNLAKKVSKISIRDAELADILWKEEDMENIDTFIKALARITKSELLTTELFIDKWISLFGPSTTFAMELYIAFSTMLTDCYCGSYINNLKTIEKVAGNSVLDFTNALFKVGSGSI